VLPTGLGPVNGYLFLLLGAALLVRLVVLAIYPSVPLIQWLAEGTDAVGYMQLSENLLRTGTFQFDGGGATAYRMPGYPFFLVFSYALWQKLLPTQIIQIVVDVLTVYVTYRLARQVTRFSAVPLLAAAVVAFHPLMVVTSISFRPETLSVFLIILATFLLLKTADSGRTALLAALLLGLAVYLKHTFIAASVLFLLAFALRYLLRTNRRSLLAAGLPLLVLMLMLVPWMARNYVVLGALVPLTTSSGSNLYGGNNPHADGGYVSGEPYVLPHLSEVASDRVLTGRALDWIKDNPLAFAQLLPLKVARLFWPLALGTTRSLSVPAPLFAGILVFTLLFYALVLYGAGRLLLARRYWELFLATAVPLTLVLSTLLTFGAARFLLPALPLFAVLASLAAEAVAAPGQAGHSPVDPSCQEVTTV
jgi:hypothetical protein